MSGVKVEICDEVCGRLIAGERSSDDQSLAEHVRSCLSCFRTAGDLRDLPRIAGLLGAVGPGRDPGDDFWVAFPARVGRAWQRSRDVKVSGVAANRGPIARAFDRFVGFIRMPLPAALSGAALAGLMVFFAVANRPAPAASTAPVASLLASVSVPAALGEASVPQVAVADLEPDAIEDADLYDLSAADLRTMLASMGADATTGRAPVDEHDEAHPSVAEEVEALSVEDLVALAQNFTERSRF